MIEKKPTRRGGARPGAGRPRLQTPKRKFASYLTQQSYAKLRVMAQRKGADIGGILDEALERMWDQDGYTLLDLESYDGE